MADTLAQTLTELLAPVVADNGLFLESVKTTRAGKFSTVRVVVDLPDGPGDIDLDALGEATTAVSQALDEADPVKGSYTLEVSSPGAERELTTARHFRRAQGHTVALRLSDGQEATGRLTAVSERSVTLEQDGQERELALTEVEAAHVVVTF